MTTESLRLGYAAFDDLAPAYDETFSATTIGRWLRSIVWERIDACFPSGSRILDIGCGTGEDAVHLASKGYEVLAFDISQSMLDIAREKAERAGCAKRVQFRCIPMEQLGAELKGERFGGAFSNFGVINCASRPGQLIADVAALLGAEAPILWVLMGRYTPWEWAWYFARLSPRKGLRRLRRSGVEWRGMRIHYPAPGELAQALAPHFTPTRVSPLGLFLPPTYASAWLERRKRLFAGLAWIERAAQRSESLAALSDHYILEARRAPGQNND